VLTFTDDPLRILRALRFATALNFEIEDYTFRAIADTRERLKIVSQERITEELRKMLMAEQPSRGMDLLRESGVAEIVFPELLALTGIEQRKDFHHKDVFYHTGQVLNNISQMSDKFELRLAALLHDIAKPQTKRFVDGVGWTFHGHEDLGARMVGKIGRRMRLPVSTIKYVQKLVRLHLRPMQLVDDTVTDSAIRRLMVDAGEELEDLMMLCRADITSKNPEKVNRYLNNFDQVEQKMKVVEEKDNLRKFRLALDGNLIMETLGIPPGPLVGQIKDAVTDAVLDGKIPNDSDACYQFMMEIKDQYL
jgi:putative nucleotidyltransferase with HDIG domain